MSGKYTEQAGGSISEIAQNDYTIYAEGNIITNAKKGINEVGEDSGVSFGSPADTPATTKVSSIKLMGSLNDGSANDGTGNNYQKGLVFGTAYEFKVTGYTNGEPINKSSIKWMIKYQSPQYSYNKWVEVEQHFILGDSVILTMNNRDMCGCDVLIRAYISDPSSEGELKLWMHNRFIFFDKKIVEKELLERKEDPSKIDQQATSLCGTAAIMYFYAKDYKEDFYKNYLELFRTGEVKINRAALKPNPVMYSFKPTQDNPLYPSYDKYSNGLPINPPQLMHQADWIILAATRSSDNNNYKGEKNQDWNAINWASYMIDTALNLYNATAAIDETSILTGNIYLDTLIKIQKEFQEGWHIILLIDSDMLEDSVSYLGCITQYHWIAYEGGLFIDMNDNKYQFSYYCWNNLNRNVSFRTPVFNTNFYGYIKFKK